MASVVHIHGKHVTARKPSTSPTRENAPCNSTPSRVGLERIVGFEPANTPRDQILSGAIDQCGSERT
jgi:hypothetical protein